MARTRRVEVPWTGPDDEDLLVVCMVTPGTPARTYGPPERCHPGDPPEVEVLEVRLDAPGGEARPELLEAAERDHGVIAERAVEAAIEADEAAEYDRAEGEEPAVVSDASIRELLGKTVVVARPSGPALAATYPAVRELAARASACLCGGLGRIGDAPCRCEAGAAGRAWLRAEREQRAQERRVEKARAARRAAEGAVRAATYRWMALEWKLGYRKSLASSRGRRAIPAAAETLARAARREALVELAVRGEADARRFWRYERDFRRAVEEARRAAPRRPEPIKAVLSRVLAQLGPNCCAECSAAIPAGALLCTPCAERGTNVSPSTPDGPAHEGAARVNVSHPAPGR